MACLEAPTYIERKIDDGVDEPGSIQRPGPEHLVVDEVVAGQLHLVVLVELVFADELFGIRGLGCLDVVLHVVGLPRFELGTS